MVQYVPLFEEEKINAYKNEYLVSSNMIPTRQHQAIEDILEFQKRFAGTIYFQRCKERLNY